jgi:hypothetical protein
VPTSLVVAHAALLRLIWTQGGAPYAVNVLGVANAAPIPITQAVTNTLGTAVKAALASSGLNIELAASVALESVGLRDINVAHQAEFIDSNPPAPGTAVGDMLPPQIALVVTIRTSLAGRSFRGRCFIPGWAETANGTNGQAAAAAGSAAAGFVNGIALALRASGMELAVVSRPAPTADPPRPVGIVTAFASVQVRDLVWDTQRRRAVPGI